MFPTNSEISIISSSGNFLNRKLINNAISIAMIPTYIIVTGAPVFDCLITSFGRFNKILFTITIKIKDMAWNFPILKFILKLLYLFFHFILILFSCLGLLVFKKELLFSRCHTGFIKNDKSAFLLPIGIYGEK